MISKKLLAVSILSALAANAGAVTISSSDNGDFVKLYGEVGVGGHFGADYDYGEFYEDQSYIDDSFGTIGIKGRDDKLDYRIELDYERENWRGGTGDMVTSIDKMFVGYTINDHNYIEVGLTDTAFDDYDKWGDFTFDTTVETGEAGDQNRTIKYEGKYAGFKAGASFSYRSESSSGSELGNIVNGYFGYFGDSFSVVAGAETRNGSDGKSKYGEQKLFGFGARYEVIDGLHLGINGYLEEEDIAQNTTTVDNTDPENVVKVYNDYQTLDREGALLSAKYVVTSNWEVTASGNYEAYEEWDSSSEHWNGKHTDWGKSKVWTTVGVNYKPTRSSVISVELNQGEAAQDAYAYARVYF